MQPFKTLRSLRLAHILNLLTEQEPSTSRLYAYDQWHIEQEGNPWSWMFIYRILSTCLVFDQISQHTDKDIMTKIPFVGPLHFDPYLN